MAQKSSKAAPVKDFWNQYFNGKDNVSNKDVQKVLENYLKDNEEKENYLKDNEEKKKDISRRTLAHSLAEQIFWPESDKESLRSKNVTKKSIHFACKNDTFGSWSTLFQTVYENLLDPNAGTQPMNYFFGRSDFELIKKRFTKKENCYCLRYHEKGGLELCLQKKAHDGGWQFTTEVIKRKKLKNKGLRWLWMETIATIGGNTQEKHYFENVHLFIKHMEAKRKIGIPVMYGSAYQTNTETEKKAKGQDEVEQEILRLASKGK